METILIQIASYKDPELPKTIASAIEQSAFPERLRFAICWQKTEEESIGAYEQDSRLRVFKMNWKDAKGVGFARFICNGMYQGEDFTLQLDSHHRFAKDWDVELIEQWKACKHPKAVLSGYPPGYTILPDGKEVQSNMPPMTMAVKGFDWGFVPTFKSYHTHKSVDTTKPFRGCFIAAGFMFGPGIVCKEVPYQKDVYFIGEEIIHSIRLFTHGYRVFHPNKWLIWHFYERRSSERHWENFIKDEQLQKKYDEIQKASVEVIRGALSDDPKYSNLFGRVNTIQEFQRYAGVNLSMRVLHPGMHKGMEPPFALVAGWEDEVKPLKEYQVEVDLDIKDIPELDDYTFWYFGLHDKDCNELYRDDIKVENAEFGKHPVRYSNKLMLREAPKKYIIWPHSKTKSWQKRLVFNFTPNQVTPL